MIDLHFQETYVNEYSTEYVDLLYDCHLFEGCIVDINHRLRVHIQTVSISVHILFSILDIRPDHEILRSKSGIENNDAIVIILCKKHNNKLNRR